MTALDTPIVALVEDDDVAFALCLCREVNRLYGLYEGYQLTATEAVRAGIALAAELVVALKATVTDGMPAMRLAVADAQTREMLTVMFGPAGLYAGSRLAPALRAASVAAIEAQVPASPPPSPRRRLRWSWRLGRLVEP